LVCPSLNVSNVAAHPKNHYKKLSSLEIILFTDNVNSKCSEPVLVEQLTDLTQLVLQHQLDLLTLSLLNVKLSKVFIPLSPFFIITVNMLWNDQDMLVELLYYGEFVLVVLLS
jgi:hypothetical protein